MGSVVDLKKRQQSFEQFQQNMATQLQEAKDKYLDLPKALVILV